MAHGVATEQDVTSRDLAEIEGYLGQHRDCRILYVTAGANRATALDVALSDAYVARITAPNVLSLELSSVDDFDARLEALAAERPTVALTYYSKPFPADGAIGERDSQSFRVRDRFLKLEALHTALRRMAVPIIMECGDMHSRVGSDHFYEQIRRFDIAGLIVNNRASIEILEEELAARRITSVKHVFWQPLGIDPMVHRDYGLDKRYNFVLYGRIDESFRRQLAAYCRRRQMLSFGRFGFTHLRRGTIDGDNLFREVNRARAALAAHQTGGTYKGRPIGMTYAKYFEIPGSRALLVGQPTPDLPHLGFVEGEHYVPITPATYRTTLGSLAREIESDRVRAITDRAFALVQGRHRTAQHINETIRDVVAAQTSARPDARAPVTAEEHR